ncbi:hypothetical protein M0802_002985 [Mischocyttarus mexicanus]|nr:hypothetical protein M0802_002985 [Mischocyttarus mexicanus]
MALSYFLLKVLRKGSKKIEKSDWRLREWLHSALVRIDVLLWNCCHTCPKTIDNLKRIRVLCLVSSELSHFDDLVTAFAIDSNPKEFPISDRPRLALIVAE